MALSDIKHVRKVGAHARVLRAVFQRGRRGLKSLVVLGECIVFLALGRRPATRDFIRETGKNTKMSGERREGGKECKRERAFCFSVIDIVVIANLF